MPTLDQVNAFLDITKDAREYKRAMAVKLLLLEFEPHDIAELLHVTESFVSKWKRLCFEHGTDVFVLKYHGYQGYLTPEQRQSITAWIKAQKIQNMDDLIAFIRTTYHIEFKSCQSYYDLFAEAGITWKRAQSQHPDKDPDRIATKKKEALQDLPDNKSAPTASESLGRFLLFFDQVSRDSLLIHGFVTR